MTRKQKLADRLAPATVTASGILLWIFAAGSDRFFNGADLLGLVLVVVGIGWFIKRNYADTKEEDK